MNNSYFVKHWIGQVRHIPYTPDVASYGFLKKISKLKIQSDFTLQLSWESNDRDNCPKLNEMKNILSNRLEL